MSVDLISASPSAVMPTMNSPISAKHAAQLKHPDWQLRKRAVDLLGSNTHPSAIPPLIEALRDEMRVIRASAAD